MVIYTIHKIEGKGMEVIEGEYIVNDYAVYSLIFDDYKMLR